MERRIQRSFLHVQSVRNLVDKLRNSVPVYRTLGEPRQNEQVQRSKATFGGFLRSSHRLLRGVSRFWRSLSTLWPSTRNSIRPDDGRNWDSMAELRMLHLPDIHQRR